MQMKIQSTLKCTYVFNLCIPCLTEYFLICTILRPPQNQFVSDFFSNTFPIQGITNIPLAAGSFE